MRTKVIQVRVTPEEKAAFQKAASRDSRTVSDWSRLHLRAGAGLGPVAASTGKKR